MYKKALFLGLAASLLGGCDTGSSDNKVEQVQQEQIAPKASSTAIFLPGGGGVDFGFLPVLDTESKPDSLGRITKIIRFDFEEKVAIEDIERSISSLLTEQGYKKVERKAKGQNVYEHSYNKQAVNPIYIRYRHVVKEGFYNKKQVEFSWYK